MRSVWNLLPIAIDATLDTVRSILCHSVIRHLGLGIYQYDVTHLTRRLADQGVHRGAVGRNFTTSNPELYYDHPAFALTYIKWVQSSSVATITA